MGTLSNTINVLLFGEMGSISRSSTIRSDFCEEEHVWLGKPGWGWLESEDPEEETEDQAVLEKIKSKNVTAAGGG